MRKYLTAGAAALLVMICNTGIPAADCLTSCLFSGVASAQSGIASIYSGTRTASGEKGATTALTAAHRTLPFGTLVRVTNEQTQLSVVVRIIDRGPFIRSRVIDVSPAAAHALGFAGITEVTLSVVGQSPPANPR